jgi:ABC-type transport system involved in Fe-S cluster assembly fused permease/ATPase subunit
VTVSNWRITLRRKLNEADSAANTRAIDSLLNYETVKYFNNEDYEARRYDQRMQLWEDAATRSPPLAGQIPPPLVTSKSPTMKVA